MLGFYWRHGISWPVINCLTYPAVALYNDVPIFRWSVAIVLTVLFLAQQPAMGQGLSFTSFLDHTQRRTTVGRTPLDEWLAHRRDLYLTTHNTHRRQTSVPTVGFERTVSAGERPQTYTLDRAATGIGTDSLTCCFLADSDPNIVQ